MLVNLDRLARRMDELDADGLVATTSENIYYLTGIASVALEMFPRGSRCFAVLSRAELHLPHFISSRCEVDQFLDAAAPLGGVVAYGPFFREVPPEACLSSEEERLRRIAVDDTSASTAIEALAATLRTLGLARARVAVDEAGLDHNFLAELQETLAGISLLPGADLLRWVRKVKTPEEVRRIAAAAAVGEEGILAAVASIRAGVTERDLVREFERAVAGAGGRPRFTLIKFGRAAVAGQTRPAGVPLRRGETVWFDVGGVVDGYWFDLARTASLGPPSERAARYYEAMRAGEEHALAMARPGMTGQELFHRTVETVRAAGVPHYRRNHVGHGIGVEVYDRVLIAPLNDDRIEEGTVVNIETPYYEFGLGAVHVEDPMVVRNEGNELLTTLPRDLLIAD
ncbi:M24 family metallopeptidase [Nonomuraea rubra]